MNIHPRRPLFRRIFLPSLTGSFRRILAVAAASVALLTQNTAQAYTHPCMPLTAADIATLNANKNTGQWATGYAALSSHWRAQLSYVQQGPFAEVGRNSNVNLNQWRNDMVAIWALSMQWKFTGDSAYAEKAKGILLSWATTHTTWTGIEPYLEMGDYMKFFGTGASILRSYSGWTTANTTTVKNYMANVHYPAWKAPCAPPTKAEPTSKARWASRFTTTTPLCSTRCSTPIAPTLAPACAPR
jgi:hypothetical protein